MAGRLDGKVALISGAGSCGPGWSNGRAAAVLFAREGAEIFAVNRSAESLAETKRIIEDEGHRCESHLCDVTESAAVAGMVAACIDTYGRIDVLFNNVGGAASGGAMDMDEADWDRQMDQNLKHVFLVTKAVLPHMVEQGGGSIVNTATTSAFTYAGSYQIGYCVSKAAVLRFSEAVAIEFAGRGIRCNTVIPGHMHTPSVEVRLAAQRTGGDVEALIASRNARIPMGKMGDAWDTAYAALFLASDESKFVTGTELLVDGGMTLKCTDLPDDYPMA